MGELPHEQGVITNTAILRFRMRVSLRLHAPKVVQCLTVALQNPLPWCTCLLLGVKTAKTKM